MGHRRPFFRRHVVVLLGGWDVAAPRGRRRPSGARESQLLGGNVITKIFSKIQKNLTATTLAYYILRSNNKDAKYIQQRSITNISNVMVGSNGYTCAYMRYVWVWCIFLLSSGRVCCTSALHFYSHACTSMCFVRADASAGMWRTYRIW